MCERERERESVCVCLKNARKQHVVDYSVLKLEILELCFVVSFFFFFFFLVIH